MSDPTNSSPRQWGGGAKRRRGMSDPTNSSPRQWGGGAKRRRGMSDPTPPHVSGEVARSAGGACQTQLLPTSVGKWREAPEGHVRPNSSPRQWGGGAKRRRGMSDPTPPHVSGQVARSAGGACQTQLLPTSAGRWREAPEGHVRPKG